MSAPSFRAAIFAALVLAAAPAAAQVFNIGQGVDIPGNDYRNVILAGVNDHYRACEALCRQDTACKAFTYSRPGFQGPHGRCWLKSRAETFKNDTCCVSGVKAAGPSAEPTPPNEYPPGCAVRANFRLEPRASLRLINRRDYTSLRVHVNGIPVGDVGPGQTRQFAYVLQVGRNRISVGYEANTGRRWDEVTAVIVNRGPRTCNTVQIVTFE